MGAHTLLYQHISRLPSVNPIFSECAKISHYKLGHIGTTQSCNFSLLVPLFRPSFRDADGDVDTSPMWTFPTVRPTSMKKLQKGYTHTDSEVRHSQHSAGDL